VIRRVVRFFLLAMATVSGSALLGQEPLRSVDVHLDRTVTFRYRDAGAKEVKFALEGSEQIPMQRNEAGVWSVVVGPLEPDFYGYSFVADGVAHVDPENPNIKPNLVSIQSVVHVLGSTPQPWEVADVPHGELHHHFYKSGVVGDQRDYYVYTPPNYDRTGKTRYPVLYLFHGYSDDASGWTSVGRAHVILDNLIAQGKAKPMIVVMPLGYGAPEMRLKRWDAWQDFELRDRNLNRFREALLKEVMPQVETAYAISARREDRAIAGLSMGRAETLMTGLNNPDKFAWIGAFSSGGLPQEWDRIFPGVGAKLNSQLSLLWISCGTEDFLINPNRELFAWLKTKGVKFTPVETPGAHTWMVWRRNLVTFASLIFQKAPANSSQ
jgi:enterochelin esterase-like enzyme